MKTKAISEKQAEEVNFAAFKTFCADTDAAKTKAIADGKAQAEQLAADIQKYTSDAKVLGGEIQKLDASIATADADKAEATKIREGEHADFEKTLAEYNENIDDLAAAITKLKVMMQSAPGASAASL